MTALIVIASIAAFIALLMLLKIKVHLELRDGVFRGRVRLLFLRWNFPGPADKDEETPAPTPETPAEKPEVFAMVKGVLARLGDIIAFVKYAFKTIYRKVIRKIAINLELHIKLATGDAATTAMAYGGASAAAYALVEFAKRHLSLKAGRLTITPDFNSTQTELLLVADLRVRVGGIVAAALAILIYAIRHKSFDLLNIVKGGATT